MTYHGKNLPLYQVGDRVCMAHASSREEQGIRVPTATVVQVSADLRSAVRLHWDGEAKPEPCFRWTSDVHKLDQPHMAGLAARKLRGEP